MSAAIPHVPIFVDDDDIESGSRIILKRIRPDWDLDKIRYKLFTDGITNKLIGIFNDFRPEDDGVLVRVYGKNTDQIIDRKTEFKNFKLLHRVGHAPDIYATFDNGMAYKYIHGETLTTTTVREPDVYRLVAKTMAKFHRVDINGTSDGGAECGLWNKIEQFASLVPNRFNCPTTDQQFRKMFVPGVEGLRADIGPLKTALENSGSPIVFSHNDLLLTNIILQRDVVKGQPLNVAFIDYEYAMPNHQAFDIANHFIEFSGVQDPGFSLYPNIELQINWLTAYLEEYLDESLDPNDQRVTVLKNQVDMFTIASHLLWTFWALVQTEFSQIDFDYLGYAKSRYDQYNKTKHLLIR
ncbi:Protein kinase-like domain [Cinara cedri]|uniref:ethanolamine kinase n=1 Tax=Cinara cedri TaxID=506608 RepID=A0A5E4N3E6_9HEMI|nr:Protein kinase-like domain [Cinara cedri]